MSEESSQSGPSAQWIDGIQRERQHLTSWSYVRPTDNGARIVQTDFHRVQRRRESFSPRCDVPVCVCLVVWGGKSGPSSYLAIPPRTVRISPGGKKSRRRLASCQRRRTWNETADLRLSEPCPRCRSAIVPLTGLSQAGRQGIGSCLIVNEPARLEACSHSARLSPSWPQQDARRSSKPARSSASAATSRRDPATARQPFPSFSLSCSLSSPRLGGGNHAQTRWERRERWGCALFVTAASADHDPSSRMATASAGSTLPSSTT